MPRCSRSDRQPRPILRTALPCHVEPQHPAPTLRQTSIPRSARAAFALLSLAVLTAPVASAQSEPTPDGNLPGHFTVSVGALFASNLDTKLRIDARRYDLGTTIDLESLLGLRGSAQSFAGQVSWRPHRRHQLSVGYFAINRSNTKALTRDIDIGDTTWTIGADVTSSFNTRYATFNYRWSPLVTSRVSAGISLQIPVLYFTNSLTATTSNLQVTSRRKSDATVPIPLPGLHATVRLARPLYLDGQAQYLKVSVSDIDADIFTFYSTVNYYPLRALGVAVGVHGDYSVIGSRTKDFTGKLRYDVTGGMVLLTWVP